MTPPIPPLAAAKLTGSLFLAGNSVTAECDSFTNSVQLATADFVETVAPQGAGTTSGMLGYMFWAAECEGTRTQCTTPPNTCQGGLGVGSLYFNIPIPMPVLRQDSVLTTVTLQSTAYLPGQGFRFDVTGSVGASCAVQTSTNLRTWISIQTNIVPFAFTDLFGTPLPGNFYRAVVVQ